MQQRAGSRPRARVSAFAAGAPACFSAVLVAGLGVSLGASLGAGAEDRPVRGWLEHAYIEPSGISLDAKLDTGARTSSIHAEILNPPDLTDGERAEIAAAAARPPTLAAEIAADGEVELIEDERDPEVEDLEAPGGEGRETLVFRVTNEQGDSSIMERAVVRHVAIKNRDGTTERRPVVEITACLAGVWVTGEVNLADRQDFNYPFLVGRNMLEASGVVVDAREIYTRSARCASSAQ